MTSRSELLQKIVNNANNFLATSKDEDIEVRRGIISFVTNILMDNFSYEGYNYIYWLEKGYVEWLNDGKPEDIEIKKKYLYGPSMDETRVKLY